MYKNVKCALSLRLLLNLFMSHNGPELLLNFCYNTFLQERLQLKLRVRDPVILGMAARS